MNENLIKTFKAVRGQTEAICAPLALEDHLVQPRTEVSPPKWHLAHSTWFFDTFIVRELRDLQPAQTPGDRPLDREMDYLFNSYYETIGQRVQQSQRGHLSRPTLNEVHDYRKRIEDEFTSALAKPDAETKLNDLAARIELGCHHEQQHQELLYMDILAILAENPLAPAYFKTAPEPTPLIEATQTHVAEGVYEIGFKGRGFSFDNEGPAHKVFIERFSIDNALVTNREYLEFIEAGGYRAARFWLSDGWALAQTENWKAPLYWRQKNGHWYEMSLHGERALDLNAPVAHVSYYEAEAFAHWAGARLPTEAEWEVSEKLRTTTTQADSWPRWQWTQSAYLPYPRYKQAEGAFGEYNGKFMCNQMVLRGGCDFTPRGHYRLTYRNFYQPEKRWAFTGFRLIR